MAYVDPATVLAPRASVRSVEVIYNTGNEGWSAARIEWEESGERLGLRWNGTEGSPGIGNPQSRGNATWFIVPRELQDVLLQRIEELGYAGPGGLLERYAEMAGDESREREAEEWSEGLMNDASAQR